MVEYIHQETVELVKVFPAEVWLAISEKLEAPIDLESFSNASPFFQKVVFEQRAAFLFPRVLEIIGDVLKDTLKRDFYEQQQQQKKNDQGASSLSLRSLKCDGCGRTRRRKWYSPLLNLRLVCRSWCAGVDQLCIRELWKGQTWGDFYWTRNDFHSENLIQQFLRHFSWSHTIHRTGGQRSPFFGGQVALRYKYSQQDSHFPSLLLLFGHHISCFEIEDWSLVDRVGEGGRWPYHASYSKISGFLRMMPCLKQLKYREYIGEGQKENAEREGKLADLREQIELCPMPTIPSLEVLDTSSVRASIFEELLRANGSHLQVLKVFRYQDQDEHYPFVYTAPLPQLKEFRMNFPDGHETELDMLEKMDWRLEKLKLSFDDSQMEWSTVFSVLSNQAWATTLQDITISHWPWAPPSPAEKEILQKCSSFRLDLPCLKRLHIVMNCHCSLDFLLPTKDSLEILYVGVRNAKGLKGDLLRTAAAEQKIQCLGYERQMYRSNIWKLFPRLKEVSYWHAGHLSKYSRKEWERREELPTPIMNDDEVRFLHRIWLGLEESIARLFSFCRTCKTRAGGRVALEDNLREVEKLNGQ